MNVKVVQNVLVDMANNDRVELSRSCDILFRSHVLSLRMGMFIVCICGEVPVLAISSLRLIISEEEEN